jgi:hypothetical protein
MIIKREVSLTDKLSKSTKRKEKRIATIERLLFTGIATVIKKS